MGRRRVTLRSIQSTAAACAVCLVAAVVVPPGRADEAAPAGGEPRHQHWSFQPVKAAEPPTVADAAWPAGPVDRFILAALEAKGLRPNPPADKRTLIRRATFDLTGLPPTPEEVQAFLADQAPDAFAKVVDRLLASPHYGERWGRHWLDVVRYADTAGDGADYPVREAYRYRNYVIDSFNRDKPYDQFLREQLAGDILAAALPDSAAADLYAELVTATGYLAISKRFGYHAEKDDFRHLDLADTIEVLGRSVLGLSVGCARCHDHKHDPVTMADYYGLYGIFASTLYTFPGGEEFQRPARLVPLIRPAERERIEAPRQRELAELDEKLKAAGGDEKAAADLRRQKDEVARRELYDAAYGVTEGPSPANARIQLRGERHNLGDEVPRRFLQVLGGDTLPPGATGSGRLELAGWLTRPDNPLTGRVMANRIWQYHFGSGLVRTPSDFGTRGEPPTHPELLDYLAARFVAQGWSIKAMHREIMLSSTYQLSSLPATPQAGTATSVAVNPDPSNDLLRHFPRRRLDAEEVRDAMLAVSGDLDRTPGGPHPFPPVQSWGFTIHNPFYAVYDTNRRSVYLMVQRQKRHPFLALFDGADPNLSTDARPATTTPTQALFLMNDPFVHARSTGVARRLLGMNAAADDRERVRLAHELMLAQEPDAADSEGAINFLNRYRERMAAMGRPAEEQQLAAWGAYARVLLTSNAFLYVD